MSGGVVPSRRAPSALAMLATASGGSPAVAPLDAIRQAHVLFAGTYGRLWDPAPNAQLAWLVALGDATAEEIASAAVAWVRDATPGDDGRPRARYAPQPCDIVLIVRRIRAESERRREQRDRDREYALRMVGEVDRLKSSGRWETLDRRERERLEQWVAASARDSEDGSKTPNRGAEIAAMTARLASGVTLPADVSSRTSGGGSACASFAGGALVVIFGLFTGARVGHLEHVREMRASAIEALASAAFRWPVAYASNVSDLGLYGERGPK